jgi:hypothetical protein
MNLDRTENGAVERRLRAYAGARLSPDAWASLRMRAEVMERGHALRDAQGDSGRSWILRFRRSLMVGLVAVLAVMAGGSAALAATPGGPLYDTRLALETALLPASGDARSDAQIGQMDERIDEAGGNANPSAVEAALAAYQTEVDAAIADAGSSADRLAKLQAVLAKHIGVLTDLEKSNPAAAATIQHAIAESSKAISRIEARIKAGPPDRPDHTPPPHDPKSPEHP